jgi:hypothetical protein
MDAVPLNSGDIAWMLAASALVLFMTPGLAFFYGGFVRNKTSSARSCRASSSWGWWACMGGRRLLTHLRSRCRAGG